MAQYKGAASEGTRATNLMKQREKQREELEKIKQKISEVKRCIENVRLIFLCLQHTGCFGEEQLSFNTKQILYSL